MIDESIFKAYDIRGPSPDQLAEDLASAPGRASGEEMVDAATVKAGDIRGTYPDQLDEDLARDIGRAFVNHLGLPGSRVVVARDMRPSGEDLQAAFIEGVTQAGADVLSLGTVSTDALYFAVGHLEEPGGALTP